MKKDTLFEKREDKPFEFNEDVVSVFPDMIQRSVPLYTEIQRLITRLSRYFYQEGTYLYDLGCSHGDTLSRVIEEGIPSAFCVGLDASPPMLKKAKGLCDADFVEHNLNHPFSFKPCSVVLLNLTLQFVALENRQQLLTSIYQSLVPGGVVMVVEKLKIAEPLTDSFQGEYDAFKRLMGYSEVEIARKKQALKGVLQPMTEADNVHLMKASGFNVVSPFIRWMQFGGFIGYKQ